MKYDEIPSDLFTNNRTRLASRLPGKALAVVHSADIPWRCADGSMAFIQNSDLFYLSGIDQEETVLLLFPSHPDPAMREILFVRETSELIAIWEGHKVTIEEAKKISGIATVKWTSEFDAVFRVLVREVETVWLNHNEHGRSGAPVNFSLDDRFRRSCQERHPHLRYERLAPLLHDLRAEKSEIEIGLVQRACDITAKGFERLLGFVKPGVMEYEVEAELLHEFVHHGSAGSPTSPSSPRGRTRACSTMSPMTSRAATATSFSSMSPRNTRTTIPTSPGRSR